MENPQASHRILDESTGIVEPALYFQKTLACETLQLITPAQSVSCSFWIGLVTPGKWTPQSLLTLASSSELLLQAAQEGVAETESFMVVDSSVQPPRAFYLMMQSTPPTMTAMMEKSRAVLEVIAAWKPQKIGFYLAESLLPFEAQFHFLTQVFTALSQEQQDRSYFYLRDPQSDYTKSVNLLLSVKEEISLQGGDPFLVLH